MDELAAISQQRAAQAQASGLFDKEILPIESLQLPSTPAAAGGPTPQRTKVLVTKDDGIRPGTTKEALGKIRKAFPQWGNGTTTGGNASQITDGVAGVLLMTRRRAEELGLEILGKHVATSVAGLPPRIMGIVRRFSSLSSSPCAAGTDSLFLVVRRAPPSPSPRSSSAAASPRTTSTCGRSTRRSRACSRTASTRSGSRTTRSTSRGAYSLSLSSSLFSFTLRV